LFIQLLIKRLGTYFPLSDEVSTIFLQSHRTAKSASFLHDDEVRRTLNIVGSVTASLGNLLVFGISQVALAKSWLKTEKGLSISVNFGGIC
jgi:hypothetical protein